ncbi:MAG: methyltransferase domain-containing protein [Acidimicrobiia bacterium]
MSALPICRGCGATLTHTLVDLGAMPLANAYLTREQLDSGIEQSYPLHARVCDECWLVQVDDVVPPDAIFSDYAYFSSYSESWLAHAEKFCAGAIERFELGPDSLVVEIASNDGYLLRFFAAAGVPVLGVEPAANVAAVAIEAGIPTEVSFFGSNVAREIASRGRLADLVVANNVLAHVPDLNDFVAGIARVLAPGGFVSVEVPHLLRMLERAEFDTIYHEHFSYFSLMAVQTTVSRHGLQVVDVDELATHGGSIRITLAPVDAGREVSVAVDRLLDAERTAGLDRIDGYATLAVEADRVRTELRDFLETARSEGRRVAAYGAAAKGNTLLNWCGVTTRDIEYVVDRNPHKQGHFMPGSHLPILDPGEMADDRPNYVVILPWNLREEITEQMAEVRDWGGRFVVAIPRVEVLS